MGGPVSPTGQAAILMLLAVGVLAFAAFDLRGRCLPPPAGAGGRRVVRYTPRAFLRRAGFGLALLLTMSGLSIFGGHADPVMTVVMASGIGVVGFAVMLRDRARWYLWDAETVEEGGLAGEGRRFAFRDLRRIEENGEDSVVAFVFRNGYLTIRDDMDGFDAFHAHARGVLSGETGVLRGMEMP